MAEKMCGMAEKMNNDLYHQRLMVLSHIVAQSSRTNRSWGTNRLATFSQEGWENEPLLSPVICHGLHSAVCCTYVGPAWPKYCKCRVVPREKRYTVQAAYILLIWPRHIYIILPPMFNKIKRMVGRL